jgi:hypothetical protein
MSGWGSGKAVTRAMLVDRRMMGVKCMIAGVSVVVVGLSGYSEMSR